VQGGVRIGHLLHARLVNGRLSRIFSLGSPSGGANAGRTFVFRNLAVSVLIQRAEGGGSMIDFNQRITPSRSVSSAWTAVSRGRDPGALPSLCPPRRLCPASAPSGSLRRGQLGNFVIVRNPSLFATPRLKYPA